MVRTSYPPPIAFVRRDPGRRRCRRRTGRPCPVPAPPVAPGPPTVRKAVRALDTIPAAPPSELTFRRRVSLLGSLVALGRSYEMIATLTERELRIRYKQAILGVAWALLAPVVLVLSFTLFIGKSIPAHDLGIEHVSPALFVILGIVPWTFFAAAVGVGGVSLLQNLQLVNKISCPREVFPLSMVAVAAVDTAVSLIAVVFVFAINRTMPHLLGLLWAPPLVLVELLYTAGVTLIISALVVHVRDIRHVLPVLLQIGIIAAPVFWSFSHLHRKWQIVYAAINPVGPVIDGFRRTVLQGRAPDLVTLGVGAISAVVVLLVGFRIFKRLEAAFADLL
jgi:ABC-type polysaccharide/polyol phosphate export permease